MDFHCVERKEVLYKSVIFSSLLHYIRKRQKDNKKTVLLMKLATFSLCSF